MKIWDATQEEEKYQETRARKRGDCYQQQVNIGSLYFRNEKSLFVDVILAFFFLFHPSKRKSNKEPMERGINRDFIFYLLLFSSGLFKQLWKMVGGIFRIVKLDKNNYCEGSLWAEKNWFSDRLEKFS